ncbi:MAG: BLUF domain-containing protein, partial [Pseudomonadota bacterium]
MKRIVYASVAAHPMGCTSNIEILRQARAHNFAHSITGFLIRSRRIFVQVLEGPEQAVDDLVLRLRRDPRHWGIVTWEDTKIEERAFPEWSMSLAFSDDEELFEDLFEPCPRDRPTRIDALIQRIREEA